MEHEKFVQPYPVMLHHGHLYDVFVFLLVGLGYLSSGMYSYMDQAFKTVYQGFEGSVFLRNYLHYLYCIQDGVCTRWY